MGVGLETLLKEVRLMADATGAFDSTRIENEWLICVAKDSAEPAEYRLGVSEGTFWITVQTEDRWLSESIESDLVESGDEITDLIDEEARARGYTGPDMPVEHFRDQNLWFTFRSPLPIPVQPDGDVKPTPANIDTAFIALMTYQEVFRELGDMDVAQN